MDWPVSLGDRDRARQYDCYVQPLNAEEKIVQTQLAHKKAQKDLDRIVKLFERAIVHYSEARYGADEVIELLAKERTAVRSMQEKIKQVTFNALPYKELDEEQVQDHTFSKKKVLGKRTKLWLCAVAVNAGLYAGGYVVSGGLYMLGIMFSLGLLSLWLHSRYNPEPKVWKVDNKVGPRMW